MSRESSPLPTGARDVQWPTAASPTGSLPAPPPVFGFGDVFERPPPRPLTAATLDAILAIDFAGSGTGILMSIP